MSNIKTTDLSSEKVLQDKANKIYEQNNKLGKDQFLNLLMTQLRNQDPLKPMDDTQFISQMAQFSSLEQMQQLTGSFSQVKSMSMVGKYAEGTYLDETTSQKETVQGYVTSTKIKDGKTYVKIDGKDILVEDVNYVSESPDLMELEKKLDDVKKYVGTKITLTDPKFTGTIKDTKIYNNNVYVVLTDGKQDMATTWDKVKDIVLANTTSTTKTV